MNTGRFRPSASMIVACVALIAAVGGSAYAASKINGKSIKSNTVTGKQVKEKSLGTVPKAKAARTANSAKRADSAATADSADSLGGETADDQKVRWLLLDEQGEIEDQSGGFTVVDGYATNSNAYIDAGESLEGKGLVASIAIQNQVDTNGVPGADPNFAGEASVSRCQIADVVACAPPNTGNVNTLVVRPSNSDGSPSAVAGSGSSTKRVYVVVSE